ncbi:MAG TPA: hypothetical protein VE476_05965 [Propionibacteriaceae bacterium]|nr:hypothetical protein [Propionibacteriaceae bacterium]
MTGPEHYQAAEKWLANATDAPDVEGVTLALRTAQVHATLANAAATYTAAMVVFVTEGHDLSSSVDMRTWDKVAGVRVQ